mmetsp:Transcript_4713/g.12611  ORF Transcript_4713/g.12611 Transcript_4713/m.12611 type:complete len:94 (+) Transcript_4713:1965-2246(+)
MAAAVEDEDQPLATRMPPRKTNSGVPAGKSKARAKAKQTSEAGSAAAAAAAGGNGAGGGGGGGGGVNHKRSATEINVVGGPPAAKAKAKKTKE